MTNLIFPSDNVGVLGVELPAEGVGERSAVILLHVPALHPQGLHYVLTTLLKREVFI